MKLVHRGLTIDLADDDARIPVIEALLFGRTLPPPLPVPALAAEVPPVVAAPAVVVPPAPPAPPTPPPVVVPAAVRAAWDRLNALNRRELAELAQGPRRPAELEKLLGLRQPQLMGQHSRINRLAYATRVDFAIRSNGRGRDARHFSIPAAIRPYVLALAAEV